MGQLILAQVSVIRISIRKLAAKALNLNLNYIYLDNR